MYKDMFGGTRYTCSMTGQGEGKGIGRKRKKGREERVTHSSVLNQTEDLGVIDRYANSFVGVQYYSYP